MSQSIALSGNCFWCLEACFQLIDGVISIWPGYYHLGHLPDLKLSPNDRVEVVTITYDETVISLESILDVYFQSHHATVNPWEIGEVFYPGTRPAIFYNACDYSNIHTYLDSFKRTQQDKVHTRLIKYEHAYFEPKDNEKNYYLNNGMDPYCQTIIPPKLSKIRNNLGHLIKK